MVKQHAGGRARSALGTAVILATAGTAGCGVFQATAAHAVRHAAPDHHGRAGQLGDPGRGGQAAGGCGGRGAAVRHRSQGDRRRGRRDRRLGHGGQRAGPGRRDAGHLHRRQAGPGNASLPAILRRLAATGLGRLVLVLGLGTNYIVTTSQLSQVPDPRAGPQAGADQHLCAGLVEQAGQHDRRGVRPAASRYRAGRLVRHDQEPDVPALARSHPPGDPRAPRCTPGWCTGRCRPPAARAAERLGGPGTVPRCVPRSPIWPASARRSPASTGRRPSSPPSATPAAWVCWPRPATGRTSSTPS